MQNFNFHMWIKYTHMQLPFFNMLKQNILQEIT